MKAGFIQFSPQFGKVDANIDKALAMLEKANAAGDDKRNILMSQGFFKFFQASAGSE